MGEVKRDTDPTHGVKSTHIAFDHLNLNASRSHLQNNAHCSKISSANLCDLAALRAKRFDFEHRIFVARQSSKPNVFAITYGWTFALTLLTSSSDTEDASLPKLFLM